MKDKDISAPSPATTDSAVSAITSKYQLLDLPVIPQYRITIG